MQPKSTYRSGKIQHGLSKKPLWYRWKGMMDRCHFSTEGTISYKNYRGAGITVCERWHDVVTFYEDMGASFIKHVTVHGLRKTSIDRIDTKVGYCLGNCRWVTPKEQRANQRIKYELRPCIFTSCELQTKFTSQLCKKHYTYQMTRMRRGHIINLQEEPWMH